MAELRIDGESKADVAANAILARAEREPTQVRVDFGKYTWLIWATDGHEIAVRVTRDGIATCTEQFTDRICYKDVPFADVEDRFYALVKIPVMLWEFLAPA